MKRDTWWGRQLQREDLLTTLEQGRRVEVELFQEKHRGLRTMGELLKARMFGATEYALSLRKRMTQYVQGGGDRLAPTGALSATRPPEPHKFQGGKGHGVRGEPGTTLRQQRHETPRPPEPHPDLDAEELWRPSHLDLVVEPLIGRLKVPSRYRRDESDK